MVAPETPPLGAEWYKVLKIIHGGILQPNKFKERPSFGPMYQVSCFFFAGWCIMFPCISWERPFFAFCPGIKDHVFVKKIPSFQIIQERSCAGAAPFGKAIFSEHLKKISYFRVFFKKDHLSFSVQRVRSYFREKEIPFFSIIHERSYPSAIFLERPSFLDVWKKKIWFSVQWVLP